VPTLTALADDVVLATAAASLVYTATVTIVALTALLAHGSTRRQDARAVLKILLRCRTPNAGCTDHCRE